MINLIMLAVAAILYVDLRIVNQMGQPISQILHVIFSGIYGTVCDGVHVYLSGSCKILQFNQEYIYQCSPYVCSPSSVYCPDGTGMCMSDSADLFCTDPFRVQLTIFVIWLVIGGAVVAYCNSFFLVKIFEKYIPEDAENADGGSAE